MIDKIPLKKKKKKKKKKKDKENGLVLLKKCCFEFFRLFQTRRRLYHLHWSSSCGTELETLDESMNLNGCVTCKW